jgi:L-fuconolactonase
MKIDAHHHFWKYNAREYGWIDDSLAALQRDFLPTHLELETRAVGIDGVVSVQARQCLEETEWLLELAGRHEFIMGVIGWVPLINPGVKGVLERLAVNIKLRGVRHVLQNESDTLYMLRPDFNGGIQVLKTLGLAYDILIYECHLPQTVTFVDRHPEQHFVLNHIAKPRIKERIMSPWRENLKELARRPNVWCKLSGVVTEADFHHWTEAGIRPYLEAALEAFGPHRLIFGSDWPVCQVACSYRQWHETVCQFIGSLSIDEQSGILGINTMEAYGLK